MMRLGRFYEFECAQRRYQAVPLNLIARGISNLEIGDTGSSEFTCSSEGFHYFPHSGLTESLDHAGVYEKRQRHAAARSSNGAAANESSAAATCCARWDVARRRAAFTVSLIVVVPSSARAISSARSSMSIRCFPTKPNIYNHGLDIYALAWPGRRRLQRKVLRTSDRGGRTRGPAMPSGPGSRWPELPARPASMDRS
jgi:hypothetical protein